MTISLEKFLLNSSEDLPFLFLTILTVSEATAMPPHVTSSFGNITLSRLLIFSVFLSRMTSHKRMERRSDDFESPEQNVYHLEGLEKAAKLRVRLMTGKAPKSSRNDCSMTSKSSEKLASPASPEKLTSFYELFRFSSNAPLGYWGVSLRKNSS